MTRRSATDSELVESKKKLVSGTYLRNAWYVAAWSDDLAEGQLLGRTVLKEPIVLFRKADGNVAALQDRCPHRFAPLHMGKVIGVLRGKYAGQMDFGKASGLVKARLQ